MGVRTAPTEARTLAQRDKIHTARQLISFLNEASAKARSPKCKIAISPKLRACVDKMLTEKSPPRKDARQSQTKSAVAVKVSGVARGRYFFSQMAKAVKRKIITSAS